MNAQPTMPTRYEVLYHSTDSKRDGAMIVDETGFHVAALWQGRTPELARSIEQIDAIAQLFAAAPELLENLHQLCELLESIGHDCTPSREAIAKATGGAA